MNQDSRERRARAALFLLVWVYVFCVGLGSWLVCTLNWSAGGRDPFVVGSLDKFVVGFYGGLAVMLFAGVKMQFRIREIEVMMSW